MSALPGRVFSTCMLLAGFTLLGLVALAKVALNAVRAIMRRWSASSGPAGRRPWWC